MHNPFWLGTPHVASEDFVYKGQFIPKDTVLVLNTYSMHHHPERHPNPYSFKVSALIPEWPSMPRTYGALDLAGKVHQRRDKQHRVGKSPKPL